MKPLDHKPKRVRISLQKHRAEIGSINEALRQMLAQAEEKRQNTIAAAVNKIHSEASARHIIALDRLREPRSLTLWERLTGWTEAVKVPEGERLDRIFKKQTP
jgi:hypothetical protein